MAYKQFSLDEQTAVTIYKRRASRSLRLSVLPGGNVRVSIPVWAPYAAGLSFAKSRYTWIKSQQTTVQPLVDGQAIGKAHHLHFRPLIEATKVSSRVTGSDIIITHPAEEASASEAVQKIAQKACIRALRQQAEQLLPTRLAQLASQHGFKYNEVSVKQLKSRWGSCDQHQNIVLNLFLMQLPWELIDYVLLHELTHTNVLKHGPDFWDAMKQVLPDTASRRKMIRSYQPHLD